MKIILHVDEDSYYASVEARDNPALRNKPLIIGSLPTERGVDATCSYEARKFGVRSAMNIKDAYRLCPQGIFMHPNYEKYKAVSDQLHKIWGSYTDTVEYMSLDEGYLDLTEALASLSSSLSSLSTWAEQIAAARQIAKEIKERTRYELDLTCSVGLGYSMTSAKMASEERKPDGYFEILRPSDFVNLIINRDVSILYGVGKQTAVKLKAEGIKTVRDIQNNRAKVLHMLGKKVGAYVTDLAFGIDEREVTPYNEADAKSLAREVTFQHDTQNFTFLKEVLMLLAVSLEARLQHLGFYARTVTLKLTFYNMKSITRSQSGENTNRAYEIFMAAFNQFNRLKETQPLGFQGMKQGMKHGTRTVSIPIRLIGISLQNLSFSGTRQLTFDDVYGNMEELMQRRWENTLLNLERKYRMKIMTDRRVDLYEAIEVMEDFVEGAAKEHG